MNPEWNLPTLTCNEYYDVWFDVSHGRRPKEARIPVNKITFPFIGDIVRNVLRLNQGGARFHIRDEDVCLTKNLGYSIVCKIRFDRGCLC